jgi:hypothetical protein
MNPLPAANRFEAPQGSTTARRDASACGATTHEKCHFRMTTVNGAVERKRPFPTQLIDNTAHF